MSFEASSLIQFELTEENKPLLLEKFKALKTIAEKFDFWREQLHYKYVFFAMCKSVYSNSYYTESAQQRVVQYRDFDIITYTEQDHLSYNSLLLNEYSIYVEPFVHKKKIVLYERLVETVEDELDVNDSKQLFLDSEIENIKDKIKDLTRSERIHTDLKEVFQKIYNDKFLRNIDFDMSLNPCDLYVLITCVNAVTYSKFHKYLIKQRENCNKKQALVEPFNIEEKFLVLDYLGLLPKVKAISKEKDKAHLISLLLGVHNQTAKEVFLNLDKLKKAETGVEKIKVRQNLQRVKGEFEKVGLKEAAKKVEADLKKLSQ